MFVGVVLPGVDQNRCVVGQRGELAAHAKCAINPASLDEDVAVVMGVTNKGSGHVEQGDTTKPTLEDLDGRGHLVCW